MHTSGAVPEAEAEAQPTLKPPPPRRTQPKQRQFRVATAEQSGN